MEYRRLGRSGLKVSLAGMGGNVFGKHAFFPHYNDEATSIQLIHHAADLGINFIDTADCYGDGVSEQYIGKAIAGRRAQFIVASKCGRAMGPGPNATGLSRAHIMNSIEGSLRRLGTDYVDVYYAHLPDAATPLDETLRAFDDLVRLGRVRYIACSNFAGWQVAAAQQVAAQYGLTEFVANQVSYSLLDRAIEAEVVPCCLHYGTGLVAYAPLAQGVLTGKYRPDAPPTPDTRGWQTPSVVMKRSLAPDNLRKVQALDEWAKAQGHRVSELAIAWVAGRPQVSSVLFGFTSREQLEANARALAWRLTAEQYSAVEEIMARNDR